jgi:hypothetical protein
LKHILDKIAPPAKGQPDLRLKPTLPPNVEIKIFEPTWKDDQFKKNPKYVTADQIDLFDSAGTLRDTGPDKAQSRFTFRF